MKRIIGILTILVVICAGVAAYYYAFAAEERDGGMVTAISSSVNEAGKDEDIGEKENSTLPQRVSLAVPYINEAPDGNWTGPWKNACEEAAIVMVERFYKGQKEVSIADAKRSLSHLFNFQNKQWGSNANSDAVRTAKIVNDIGLFRARIVTNPTLEDIKKELAAERPVISLHKGFDLGNKNIPFLATGSSYHTLVLIGYDDSTGEFITHDDGDSKAGNGRRYKYDVVMNSLHDYSFKTNLADGPPTVIFSQKP